MKVSSNRLRKLSAATAKTGTAGALRRGIQAQRKHNLLLICELQRGWCEVSGTKMRTRIDFAHAMKQLVQTYVSIDLIRVVLDNLNAQCFDDSDENCAAMP